MFHSKRTVSPVFSYKVPNFSGSRHFHQPYHHFLFNDTKQKPPAAPVHTENRGTGSSLCIYRRTAKSPQADIRLRAKTLLSQQSLHRRGIGRNCQQHRAPLLPQDRILQLRDLPGTVVPVVLDLTLKIGLQSALGGLGGAAVRENQQGQLLAGGAGGAVNDPVRQVLPAESGLLQLIQRPGGVAVQLIQFIRKRAAVQDRLDLLLGVARFPAALSAAACQSQQAHRSCRQAEQFHHFHTAPSCPGYKVS